VGTSNLALNLAIALGERGRKVLLVDADLGLANLDLLCGLAPRRDLGDVLLSGRALSDAIVEGPAGIRLLAGAHGTRSLGEMLNEAPARLAAGLEAIEGDCDFVLIDAGSGLSAAIGALASAVDGVVLVTTPEPTAMADACAALRRLGPLANVRLVATQARSKGEADECLARVAASGRQFLGLVAEPLGSIRCDYRVPLSVRARRPFVQAHPYGPAARDVRRLADALIREGEGGRRGLPGLFASLAARRRAAG
jgi:flagellar biosynthesis protein FlhG